MASKGAYTLVVEDRFGALTDEYTFDSGELVVGRSRQCDIVLPSENVSRRHARIRSGASGLLIEDLQSANGVFVNGRRVFEPLELADQDVIRLGDFHLHVHGGRKARDERPVYVRLVGTNLTVAEQVFEITSTTTLVGRGKDCGLVLVDPSISRVHARVLVRADGTVLVEDVGSANGVTVNGRRVKVWQIAGGDKLRFGNVEFLVEIPTGNTVETPQVSGLFRRVGRKVASNLPWVVAAVCAVTVVVLLAVFVPDYVGRDRTTPQAAPVAAEPAAGEHPAAPPGSPPPPEPAVAPAAGAPAAAPVGTDRLAAARKLLADAKVEDAAREVAMALAADPTSLEAIRLSNRVDVERSAAKAVTDADRAVTSRRFDDAAAALLRVPTESVFHEQAKAWLTRLQPELDKLRRRACRSETAVDCVRLKALVAKVQKTL